MVLYRVIRQKSSCDLGCYLISPQSVMTIFLITPPSCKPKDSILVTTSIPSFTCPNTTCLPSSLSKEETQKGTSATGKWLDLDVVRLCVVQRWDVWLKSCTKHLQSIYHSVLAVQMKNWEPLVFGPEFAIESVPAEITNPTSKSINCDTVNKLLTSFYH